MLNAFVASGRESLTEQELFEVVKRKVEYLEHRSFLQSLLLLTETYILKETSSGAFRFFVEGQRIALLESRVASGRLERLRSQLYKERERERWS